MTDLHTRADLAASMELDHPDDIAVDQFAIAMKAKLKRSRDFNGRDGWQDMTADQLSIMLLDHVQKGDPLDVGNLAMMLHQNGYNITPAADSLSAALARPVVRALVEAAVALHADMIDHASRGRGEDGIERGEIVGANQDIWHRFASALAGVAP